MKLRLFSAIVIMTLGLGSHLTTRAADSSKSAEKTDKPADKPGDKPGDKPADKKSDITEPQQALVGIPHDVLQDLRPGSRKMDAALEKATSVVKKNVEKKTATFKMTIKNIEKYKPEGSDASRFRLTSVNDKIREGGASFEVYLMTVPDPSEDAKVAKLKKGDKVTFTGTINHAEVLDNKMAGLHIDVMDSKLVK